MSDDTNICTCYSLIIRSILSATLFFFNDTATTEIYTLSLHDALPISRLVTRPDAVPMLLPGVDPQQRSSTIGIGPIAVQRSEEHTSELQSQSNLVCRLLLEKKKKK